MTNSPLKRVAPATVNRTVTMPRRKPNSVYRTRAHLTGAEVNRLIDAAKANRWGHRDATIILVAFRHGLRTVRACKPAVGSNRFHPRRPRPQGKKGTPAAHVALRWPTRTTIRERCRLISATAVRYTELSPGRFKDFWKFVWLADA